MRCSPFRRQLALLDRVLVVLADRRQALVQRFLLRLEDGDRDAGVREVHGDAAAHGAGADHGRGLDLADRRIGRHVRDLAGGALGKESMAQGLRLHGLGQVDEALALELAAFFERQVDGGGDGLDAFQRRREAPEAAFTLARAASRKALRIGVLHLRSRTFGSGLRTSATLLAKADGCRPPGRPGREHLVEQRAGQLLGQHRIAGHDHVERRFQPDHARQALGAAGARQQAELHFRQRDLGARRRHAVVRSPAPVPGRRPCTRCGSRRPPAWPGLRRCGSGCAGSVRSGLSAN
jgi:hypothetical protein